MSPKPHTDVGLVSEPRLSAEPGDRLVIHGHHQGQPARDAEVLEVRGVSGGPPFLVRWEDSGRETVLYPGADAYVEHVARRRPPRKAARV